MFNVHDPDFGLDAVFLHPALAMANHSCVPNASAHISGRAAILVSERDIAEGEEVTISYTGTALLPSPACRFRNERLTSDKMYRTRLPSGGRT